MPAQRPQRPAVRDQVVEHHADTRQSADRMISELARVQQAQAQLARKQLTVDLVVGSNRIAHNLGRKPKHVTLMPTDADAAFAWAVSEITERQLVIVVVGADQPGASLEVS